MDGLPRDVWDIADAIVSAIDNDMCVHAEEGRQISCGSARMAVGRAILAERERATLAERERDEHLRAKNNLVLAAYPAMDAVDAIRKWCDGQRYANDVITVALLQEMLPRP